MASSNTQNPNDVDLSFIRDAIEEATAKIQERLYNLPEGDARTVAQMTLDALNLTAASAKLHCGPGWFFLPR